MAQQSKTFAGSALTATGSAAVVGSVLRLAAAASYEDDFESYSIGVTPTNWTAVGGTVTVQSQSGQKVMRVNGGSWAGAYHATDFGDGTFEFQLVAAGGRGNHVARYHSTLTKGYTCQFVTGASEFKLYPSIPSNFVGITAPELVEVRTPPNPSLPAVFKLHTLTRADASIDVIGRIGSATYYVYNETANKWPAGRLAFQAFAGNNDVGYVKFWPVLTGGFTFTATPYAVTSLTRILIEADLEAASARTSAGLFQYQIDGGTWTALPEDGYVNAACVTSIGVRANSTLKNDYDATANVNINSVAIEIAGTWETPTTPSTVASLAATPTDTRTIALTWTDAASADFVYIYQNTVNNSATAVLQEVVAQGAQAVSVSGLAGGTLYYFWAKTTLAGVLSAFSSVASATTTAAANPTTGLAVTITGRTSARLTWVDGASGASVDIYRGTTSVFASAAFVAMVLQGVQVYTDEALSEGTTYYWWTKVRNSAGDLSVVNGPVTDMTIGVAGSPGSDIVTQIVDGFKARIAAVLPSEYKQLPYARDLAKNDRVRRDKGYGVVPGSSAPGEPALFRNYTQTHDFEVVLTRSVAPGKEDRRIEVAEQELYQWFDRLIRDCKGSRLYETDVVVRIGDPSAGSPEYFEDLEMVAIRYTFPVTYRNTLS